MKRSEKIIDHLNLDEVWHNPDKSWSYWANIVGAHPQSVADAMKREGWERNSDGRLMKTPCVLCYKTTHRRKLNDDRICFRCNHPNRNLYERELKKFLQRHPHMISGVQREL